MAFVALACFPLQGHGQGGAYVREDPDDDFDVDDYHAAISKSVMDMTDRVDLFFADDRILEETDKTQLRLTSKFRYEDGKDLTFQLRLKGHIVMPYLENKLQLIVDGDGPERDVKSNFSENIATDDESKSLFTGLRYVPDTVQKTRLSLDGGVRWHSGPVPFVRVRARRTFDFDLWQMKWTQKFFWYEDKGVGESTQLDFERWTSATHFFRASSSATFSETSQGIDLQQDFTIYNYISKRKMIGFGVNVQGHTWPETQVDSYTATFQFRRQVHRDWLFLELAPGATFPRYNNFDLTPIITFKIEILFGDVPILQ